MKILVYAFLKISVRIGFFFFYRDVKVVGYKNIPKNKPVILLPNHQNAFMDSLLTATYSRGRVHFMTRGDIFQKPLWRWILFQMSMRPIYRIRDGVQSLGKNEAVFRDCYNILHNRHSILIHPEGNHDHRYRVRHISKGFTRIVCGALEEYPDMDLYLVPVGLNYSDHHKYRSKVSVYYDKAIKARSLLQEDGGTRKMKEVIEQRLKKITVHIDEENYDSLKSKLERAGADFTDPYATNAMLAEMKQGHRLPAGKARSRNRVTLFEKLLYPIVYLNNIIPILIWKFIKRDVKDPGFQISIKLALGVFLLPLIYLFQTYLVLIITHNPITAACYLFLSVFSVSVLSIRQGKDGFKRPR